MVSGLLKLLRSFLHDRLSAAAVNGFSSSVLRWLFGGGGLLHLVRSPEGPSQDKLSMLTGLMPLVQPHILISQVREAGGSPTQTRSPWNMYFGIRPASILYILSNYGNLRCLSKMCKYEFHLRPRGSNGTVEVSLSVVVWPVRSTRRCASATSWSICIAWKSIKRLSLG